MIWSMDAGLRSPEIDAAYALVAQLVGDPGWPGAAPERCSYAEEHLGEEYRPQQGDETFHDERGPHQKRAQDEGEPAPIDVGHYTGRDLEQEDGHFEHGADEDQLEGPRPTSTMR